jgi:hypothetical protein
MIISNTVVTLRWLFDTHPFKEFNFWRGQYKLYSLIVQFQCNIATHRVTDSKHHGRPLLNHART